MFTRLGLPMNHYTFVSFRKPKRFRVQMPTSTSNLYCNTVTQGHLVRENFEIRR